MAEDPAPRSGTGVVGLRGAGGEWLDLVVQQRGNASALRVGPLQRIDGASAARPMQARIYQIADVEADTNHAAYLRLFGGEGGKVTLPRALLPLAKSRDDFQMPADVSGRNGRFWIDLEVPRGLERGTWRTTLSGLDENGRVVSALDIEVQASGFDLPVERTLVISAPVEWDRLLALWPDEFRGTSPALLSRSDERSRAATTVLDGLITQAQQDRVQVTFPALGGVVKWPAGRPPEADWRDFDDLVIPWLTGEAFADGVGLRGWPVPEMRGMEQYPPTARAQYWQAAIDHLEEKGVLNRCVVFLDDGLFAGEIETSQRQDGLSPVDRMSLSQEAGRIARLSQAGRIAIPLESDQVRFTGPEHPDLYPPEEARRLVIRADGLVTNHATRPWPAGLPQPGRYIDAGAPSAIPAPQTGAGEADVRLWGWLAFLRGARYVKLDNPLPAGRVQPVDPTQLTLFYPGAMFGRSEPVPTVALKWLRRAQQDYEYLAAAAQRGEETYARVIARALVRPVRVGEGAVDPVLPLLAGTFDASLWTEGLSLVDDKVAIADARLSAQLSPRFVADHTNRTTAWLSPRERPAPVISGTQWDLHADGAGGHRLVLGLSMNIYNPSDARPEGVSLVFAEMPGGETPSRAVWENPGRIILPEIATYELASARLSTSATVDALALVFPTFQQGPMRITARNEYSGAEAFASAVAPAMVIDQRRQPPVMDGQLSEWLGNEAIIDGRMVQMHSRPALQTGEVVRADKPAQAFVVWTIDGLHIAFRLEEAGEAEGQLLSTRNFVDIEQRRVWGEDVCEVLIQPVWSQNGQAVDGPLLHVICKPNGAFVRRRTDRRAAAQPWQNFESGMQYAATVENGGVWRAELTLPWSALRDAVTEEQLGDRGREARPALLRFNLSHHDGETGRSASWAGPVDFGADERFTGALILRPQK